MNVATVSRHSLHVLGGARYEKAVICGLFELLQLILKALHHDFARLRTLIVLVRLQFN